MRRRPAQQPCMDPREPFTYYCTVVAFLYSLPSQWRISPQRSSRRDPCLGSQQSEPRLVSGTRTVTSPLHSLSVAAHATLGSPEQLAPAAALRSLPERANLGTHAQALAQIIEPLRASKATQNVRQVAAAAQSTASKRSFVIRTSHAIAAHACQLDSS